jgi:hypothetical protein
MNTIVNVTVEERFSVDVVKVIQKFYEIETQHSYVEKRKDNYFRVSPGSYYDDEKEITKEEYKAIKGLADFLAFHKK